jgi:hypothetical protein
MPRVHCHAWERGEIHSVILRKIWLLVGVGVGPANDIDSEIWPHVAKAMWGTLRAPMERWLATRSAERLRNLASRRQGYVGHPSRANEKVACHP